LSLQSSKGTLADMMTVVAHIAEWFIRNEYCWRIMKFMFSIIEKKVICTVVVIHSV
jgi:hypothetical protein